MDAETMSRSLRVLLLPDDAQALYDLTGTLPWSPESWTDRLRHSLSVALHEHHTRVPVSEEEQ